MGAAFVFLAEAGKRPLWWDILASIWLVGIGVGAFSDFRRLKNKIPVFLVLFALGAALVYLGDIGRRPLWWNILAGIGLVGTGIGSFYDFHFLRDKFRNRDRVVRPLGD